MVSRLGLSAGAPPALVRICHPKPQPVGARRRVPRQELVVAAGEGLPHSSELGSSEAAPRRGPISSLGPNVLRDPLRRPPGPCLGGDPGHCERDVSPTYPSGTSSTGSSPVAALLAYLSATSLPVAPLCAGPHRMVTSLSLVRMREQISMAATANCWPGLRASFLTRSMAVVESTNTVYRRPLS